MSLSHYKGMSVTPEPRGVTAMEVTGTATFSGPVSLTGDLKVASVANGLCGVKTIAAASAGIGVISSTKIIATSRILLTPCSATIAYPMASVRKVGTGTASVRMNQLAAGTNATASGRLYYQVINL